MNTRIKTIPLLFIIILAVIAGCSISKKNNEQDKPVKSQPEMSQIEKGYFKANGFDPSWSLRIDTVSVEFASTIKGLEKVTFAHKEPVRAMDMNVKMYTLQSKDIEAKITIIENDCIPPGNTEPEPYKVTIEIKRSSDKDYKSYSGCGHYITDYRLYDIWALQEINGTKATAQNPKKQVPYIEINTSTNTFSGFAGCNNIGGKIFSERKLIRFTNIISTLMACEGTQEQLFLTELPRVTSYELKNGRLILKCDGKINLIFKKVD